MNSFLYDYAYTLTFLAFGISLAAVAILAGVEAYKTKRARSMTFVQLHRRRMRGLK